MLCYNLIKMIYLLKLILMKNKYFFVLFLISNFWNSQCIQYPQMLNDYMSSLMLFDEQHLVGIGGTTILNTENKGKNWNLYPFPVDHRYYSLNASKKINDSTGIAVGYHGKILKTTDKGKTWENQSLGYDGNEYLSAVEFINDDIGYIFGDYKYNEPNYFRSILYKTIDGGRHWKKVETNINASFYPNVASSQMKFINENLGFLFTGFYLYRTLNGGVTWTEIQGYSDLNNIGGVASIDLLNDNKLVINLNGKIYTSTDWGTTLQKVPELQYPNPIFLGKVVVHDQILYGITSENLLTYNFDTQLITQKPIPNINHNLYGYLTLVAIDFFDQDNIAFSFISFTGNTGKKIIKTKDGGDTWENVLDFTADSGQNYEIFNNNQNFVLSKFDYSENFSKTRSAGIYLSTDNAVTWKEIERISNGDQNPFLMDFAVKSFDANYLSYLYKSAYSNGQATYYLKESTDLGKTWTSKIVNIPPNLFFVNKFLTQVTPSVFFYTNINTGMVSLDKGDTFKICNAPVIPNFQFSMMKFVSPTEIYAWGRYRNHPTEFDYELFKTSNLGDSWESVARIPFTNTDTFGSTANYTYFGSGYAIVSTGSSKYFTIDLATKEVSPFDGYIPNNPVYTQNLKIINDNYWYHPGNEPNYQDGSYFYSTDKGKSWKEQRCFICVGNLNLNPITKELVITSPYLKMEKITNQSKISAPKIFGNTQVEINKTEEYFIPQDRLSETEWMLDAGGIITFDPLTKFYKIKIKWTEEGVHQISAKKSNACNTSPLSFLSVTVHKILSTDNVNIYQNNLIIYPNPFSDHLRIVGLEAGKTFNINMYDSSGKIVLSKENLKISSREYLIENLDNLIKGLYYLEIKQSDKTIMKKAIKK